MVKVREDRFLLDYIWRVNLNTFSRRERSIVANNVTKTRKIIRMSGHINLKGLFMSWGHISAWDYCGYEIAIDVVL